MSVWGKSDSANSIPLSVAALVKLAPSLAVRDSLYKGSNTTVIPGMQVGIFPSRNGWVLRRTGTGGRNGRINEEILTTTAYPAGYSLLLDDDQPVTDPLFNNEFVLESI